MFCLQPRARAAAFSTGAAVPTPLQTALAAGGWEHAWRTRTTPWEAGAAPPALLRLLRASPPLLPARARVLVPGCGLGHDAAAFAAAGHEVLGLDLSPTAVAAARARHPGVPFEAADFFAWSGRPFDFAWDYTFYAALPPALRPQWAAALGRAVAAGGRAAVLLFPVDGGGGGGGGGGGPPFNMEPEEVCAQLRGAGFSRERLGPVPAGDSFKPRAGREWLGVWEKQAPPL